MTYAEKLKDPRWQKRRLEVLERDNWTCQSCDDIRATLHVHHKKYFKGRDAWDIDPKYLETLCERCHRFITLLSKKEPDYFILSIKMFPDYERDGFHHCFVLFEFKPAKDVFLEQYSYSHVTEVIEYMSHVIPERVLLDWAKKIQTLK